MRPKLSTLHSVVNRFAPIIAFRILILCAIQPAAARTSVQFELSFPAATHAQAITGRAFVIVTKSDKLEPRIQLLSEGAPGKDVNELGANQTVTIDANV